MRGERNERELIGSGVMRETERSEGLPAAETTRVT
jgi:hypothetical protein